MSDSPAMSAAAVEVIQLYRELVAEIRHRENVERSLSHTKHSRDLAEKECEDLKKKLESTELAWKHNVASLTHDLKEQQGKHEAREQLWTEVKEGYEREARELETLVGELREENAKLKGRLEAARIRAPKMKEDDRALPVRCLRCGAKKGKRAYTCTKCFSATHREDQDPAREEWAKLRDDWLSGERDFPEAVMVGGDFSGLYRVWFWIVVIGIAVSGATCFGAGYAYRGCESRPSIHFEMKKTCNVPGGCTKQPN